MGRPTGFEPATPRITILCSNQLSYGRRAEGKKFASSLHPVKAQFEIAAWPLGLARSGLTPLPQPIKKHCYDDHQANNNFLKISRPTHLLRTVAQDRHN